MDRNSGAMLQGSGQITDRTFVGLAAHSDGCGFSCLVLKL